MISTLTFAGYFGATSAAVAFAAAAALAQAFYSAHASHRLRWVAAA